MTKIVEKYFEKNDFKNRVEDILKIVCDKTHFEPEKVIFRGMIYDEDKLGSVIYKGIYKNKDAVLKLQGLRPETDEIDIIASFKHDVKSNKIRLPKLFEASHWNEKDNYGYLITEYITAPHIFEMPFATDTQMARFSEFYQEYRTSIVQPFIQKSEDEKVAADFVLRRISMWDKIAAAKGLLPKRLSNKKVNQIIERFKKIQSAELKNVKMVFSHGHLTANDIYDNGSEFILLSNLYWSYRPELYDLVFGLHWCLENIQDNNYTFEEYLAYIDKWLTHFYEIPFVKNDHDAKRKINLMLLERTMGGILLDTGSQAEDNKFANHLLKLQTEFFDLLGTKIENKDYL
ncbi:MAG TPA: hypothetical protein VG917_01160 [Patescibacteria group bacterium]|nr:hypothetical protein [Patescibacteria group bacterium]